MFTEKRTLTGRRIDRDPRQRLERVGRADRVADLDRVDSGDDRDLARGRDLALDPLEPLRREELGHAERLRLARLGNAHDGRAAPERPALDPADHEPPDELVPAQGHRLELQRAVHVDLGRRRLLEDQVEQRAQVLARAVRFERGRALLRRRVDDREVELVVVGAELHEQVEHLVHHLVRALLRAVDLVHHHDRAQALRERLAQHEAGLRHHALDRVDQQQHRVDHAHDPLDLAAEVGVAGGVDQLDAHAVVLDRRALGVDRDPALALEVLAVHRALLHFLIDPEGAGLAQESVQQGGLAVVDVRDDREVADVFAGGTHCGAGR